MYSNQDLLDKNFSAGQFPAGAHICLIYENEEERRELVLKFLKGGLDGGEKVLYFTDVMSPTQLLDWLADMGVDIPSGADKGRLSVLDAESVYCPDGEFRPERMFDYWGTIYDEANSQGYPAVRATGETSWAVRDIRGADRLIEYEALLNKTLEKVPVAAFCQYDVNLFDGGTILDVLRVHPVIISRGQLVKNPLYVGPDEFLAGRLRSTT